MFCFDEIKKWIYNNYLQLNKAKSAITIIAPSGPSTSSTNNISSGVGVLFNNVKKRCETLVLCSTVTDEMCNSALYYFKIRSLYSSAGFENAIHACMFSKLDYCNTLVNLEKTTSDTKHSLLFTSSACCL